MKKLYHIDAYGLPNLPTSCTQGVKDLTFSDHAIHAAHDDRYGYLNLSRYGYLDVTKCQIIEVETFNDVVVKIVYRLSYDSLKDIVLAVLVDTWQVKTVWANLLTDVHLTLDKSKYCKLS